MTGFIFLPKLYGGVVCNSIPNLDTRKDTDDLKKDTDDIKKGHERHVA